MCTIAIQSIIRAICAIRLICDSDKWHMSPRPDKSPMNPDESGQAESRSRFSGFTPIHRGRQERNRRDSEQLGLWGMGARRSGQVPTCRDPRNGRCPSHSYKHVALLGLRTCFKKLGVIPRCCGFVNPQRAVSRGRGWFSQPVGRGNLAPTKQSPSIGLTRFAKYSENVPSNRELWKKPSFEVRSETREKTRFHGIYPK